MSIFSGIKKRMNATLDPFLDPVFTSVFESSPLAIYDVGAAGGVYCPLESPPCQRAQVYGFEPVKRSYDSLIRVYGDNPFVEIRNVALAGHDGTIELNEVGDGNETHSSIMPLDGLGVATTSVEVECCRLDNVPERFGFPPADFIKLDTEGSEAVILSQGQKMLAREVLGVVSEITFWRENVDSAVFSDIDRILTQAGFILFDLQINRAHISSIGGKKDKLRSGDALYLRDFRHLAAQMSDASSEQRRTKLLKLVCLCVAWRYLNYALELIDHGRQEGLISPEDFSRLSSMLTATIDLAERIPDFPGRLTIARLADVISYALHRRAKKGIPAAFNEIGNSWVVARRGERPTKVEIYKPVISDGPSKRSKTIDLGAE